MYLTIIVFIWILVWIGMKIYTLLTFLTFGNINNLFKPKEKETHVVYFTPEYHNEWNKEEPTPIPYYIDDEIEAIYTQLDVYNRMIEHYNNDLEYTTNVEQRLKLEKKISDLKYKCSRLENKVNKLLEKWEG